MKSLLDRLWEKLTFWKKPDMPYREKVDYDFIDFNEPKITGIILLMPDYENVVYHYHKVRVVEEKEIGFARLEYGYTIVDSGKHNIDALNVDEKFHEIMGDILHMILLRKIKDEQTGTDDTEELDLQ
jgi:hypothetical protein